MPATIAVVDDEVSILDAAELLLTDQGWYVRTYVSGEDFLADVDLHCPDCLLLDVHLPGIGAADIMRRVMHGGHAIPVIGLTARPHSAATTWLRRSGARVVLTKPVSADRLIRLITAALADRQEAARTPVRGTRT